MKTSNEVLNEINYVLANKNQFFNNGSLTPLGKMKLSQSVASMGEIIKSEHGTYKLYEILDEITKANQDDVEHGWKSFKQLEYMLYGMKEKGLGEPLSEIKKDRGELNGLSFATMALRVARAENLQFPDCQVEYDSTISEEELYKKRIATAENAKQKSVLKKDKYQEEIDNLKERLQLEQQYEGKQEVEKK